MKHLLLIFVLASGFSSPICAREVGVAHAFYKAAMPRQPVKSSDITSIGYDASTSTLEVEFRTGAVYQYYSVPRSVYEGRMGAKSHGSYFARYVKAAGYRYKEL